MSVNGVSWQINDILGEWWTSESGILHQRIGYDNGTALHLSCQWGFETFVECILKDWRVEINERDNSDYTPLNLACVNGHYKIAQLLIDGNADVNLYDDDQAFYCRAFKI